MQDHRYIEIEQMSDVRAKPFTDESDVSLLSGACGCWSAIIFTRCLMIFRASLEKTCALLMMLLASAPFCYTPG